MSKVNKKRVVGIKPTTFAMFQGTFAALIGFGIAILYSLKETFAVTQETSSVLTGMAFGLGVGVVSMFVLPLIYFAFGWLIGFIQGWLFTVVASVSGGIVVDLEDE